MPAAGGASPAAADAAAADAAAADALCWGERSCDPEPEPLSTEPEPLSTEPEPSCEGSCDWLLVTSARAASSSWR